MIDFENTQIAFQSKSDKELSKAFKLYKVLSHSSLLKMGKGMTKAAMAIGFPINWAVKPTIYSLFVGGETIEECKPVVEHLGKFGVKAILDYSVEGKEDESDMEKALEETLKSVKNAGADPNIPFSVFKPTAFGNSEVLEKVSKGEKISDSEQKSYDNFVRRIELLCKTAYEADIPILIDAEDVHYQQCIDDISEQMMIKYNKEKAVVFNTWQMYRHDRLEHLKQTYKKAEAGNYFLGAKFVRGAYMERERALAKRLGLESPIYPTKQATDDGYNAALKFSIDHIDRMAIFNGTHNEESSLLLAKWMDEKGMDRKDNRVWFSQLYGMSDHISFNLANAGFNVAKYLPYGPVKHVLPYLFRRAEENTSAGQQAGREITFIMKEMERRKLLK